MLVAVGPFVEGKMASVIQKDQYQTKHGKTKAYPQLVTSTRPEKIYAQIDSIANIICYQMVRQGSIVHWVSSNLS